jgi:hypothetical protein
MRRIKIDAWESNGFINVTINTEGDSYDDALYLVSESVNAFVEGERVHWRANPEAQSDTDFDTKETRHVGYARFSVEGELDRE